MWATEPDSQGDPAATALTFFSSVAHDFSYTERMVFLTVLRQNEDFRIKVITWIKCKHVK